LLVTNSMVWGLFIAACFSALSNWYSNRSRTET
jgi:hypothetical protein